MESRTRKAHGLANIIKVNGETDEQETATTEDRRGPQIVGMKGVGVLSWLATGRCFRPSVLGVAVSSSPR